MSFTWPDGTILAPPTVNFNGKVQTTVIRTKMDSGRVRQRNRFSAAVRSIEVEWVFTDDEFALFQGIYKFKITNGADFFNMSLPFGDGFKTYLVRFSDAGYAHQYKPHFQWTISATLETEDDTSPLSESEVDAALS